MKITWLDLNSSYSHSSLALPAIHAQAMDQQEQIWSSVHTTINHPIAPSVQQLLEQAPDIVCATAWLFTHNQLLEILTRFKALCPQTLIILGGPEFQGNNEAYLRQHPAVDLVFRGEGEIAFHQWLERYQDPTRWHEVEGCCFINQTGEYIDGGMARVKQFNELITPEQSPFFQKERPFVQFETTRGCFNTCAFCVSGTDKPVRALSLAQIRERLQGYYDMGIQSIRMLDRTFNAQQNRALEMLDLFQEFDGKLTFHLEVHPAYLSPKVREALASMPDHLLHIEAGIQSLNEDVLKQSQRLGSLQDSLDGLRFLSSLTNLETHADLIAGLPGYTLEMIEQDIYTLAQIGCDEIQLESLKLLPGTVMRHQATTLGITFAQSPPYEVLQSKEMTFLELSKAMQYSKLLDMYYNHSPFQRAFRACLAQAPQFLADLANSLAQRDLFAQPLSGERKGTLLLDFVRTHYPALVLEVTQDWILAGLSIQKLELAELRTYLQPTPPALAEIIKGEFDATHRNYSFPPFIWGYDRAKERQKPVFFARLA